jgi:hypothetical protein
MPLTIEMPTHAPFESWVVMVAMVRANVSR